MPEKTDCGTYAVGDSEITRGLFELITQSIPEHAPDSPWKDHKMTAQVLLHPLQLLPSDLQFNTLLAEETDRIPPPFQKMPLLRRLPEQPLERIAPANRFCLVEKRK